MEVNGVSLCYELGGRGDETVIFVHESGGSLHSWDETLPTFQEHFRTLRYDQRGFGLSEKIRGGFVFDEIVEDINGLLAGLGISGPCHLVGSAYGSAIVLAYAARHPSRVARLAVASPVTSGGSGGRKAEARELRAATIEREGMRSYVTQSLSTSYPEVLRGNIARFEGCRARWLANDPWCFAALNRMIGEMDLNPELSNIESPTLVLGATHDLNRLPELSQSIARQIRGARFVEVDSGHFLAVQTPELFAKMVVPFLQGRDAPRV